MGRDVAAVTITKEDRRLYRDKVRRCLEALSAMLRESRFEDDRACIGMEVELNLVDETGRPAMRNAAVLESIADPGAWATELAQFNIEINMPPGSLAGKSLAMLEQAIRDNLNHADGRARTAGAELVMVGILPTLRESDLGEAALSANPRYRLLNEQVLAARGENLSLDIDGVERLRTTADCIAPEAACTSVQFHLQVGPDDFAASWNAAQAIAGVQVAVGANSPFLFGRELWRETRLPLFEQATDTRSEELKVQGVRPRVWFGERWIDSAFDLFEENSRYFSALLPLCEDEDPLEALARSEIPELAELSLHNGTIYRWNRPVYAVGAGRPHLRVENRVLPAGPTVADTMANAAFYYGLVRALAEEEHPVWERMSFASAADNARRGARYGLDARVFWPGVGEVPVAELVLSHLLPKAVTGLDRWGVDTVVRDRLLGIIEQRCVTGQNGATWQVETVRAAGGDREEALRLMTRRYVEHMHTNAPVHTWPIGVYWR
ncbi:glutamate--cysteine ligase [Actinoallomurus purpureus]|uniref:glutamate--cysteine ligase n=1 Tax=Actinoallomurus purpureus TaxID=478114 RepID=UPI002093D75D|nr:glutamate--cysteine ligase [Actinoallomurus purpureus]MCO6011201.1 glutamate--cysteine ligase [Actinoallomurus purpureus]